MKSFILWVLTIMAYQLQAQSNRFIWAKQFGGVLDDRTASITTDKAGNVYTTGFFSGTADFDPGAGAFLLKSWGGNDAFVSKLDAAGNSIWTKQLGGLSKDEGLVITVDDAANVYIAGGFSGSADFDPGPGNFPLTAKGEQDIFICKLDASGNLIWVKQMGGKATVESIVVDQAGSIYTSGLLYDITDFDPGPRVYNLKPSGYSDIFISKLDRSGNFVWARKSGDYGRGDMFMALDGSGNMYITGGFSGTLDLDLGPGVSNLTSVGASNIYIAKLDTDGNLIWAKQIGGSSYDASYAIAADASGNVYITGEFSSSADFDPGPGTYNLSPVNAYDIFISRLDKNGNLVWVKQIGGTGYEGGSGIAVDGLGNVYISGSFTGTADFSPKACGLNLSSAGQSDIFISKLDKNGNLTWVKQMGGSSYDDCHAIAVDVTGNVYAAGAFSLSVDFDPTQSKFDLNSFGDYDAFVLKLGPCSNSTSSSISVSACNAYTFNCQTYTSSGVYTQTTTNAAGCDSIVTLHLTILPQSLVTIDTTICQGENYAGHTSSGTYIDTLSAANGCSIRTLKLTVLPKPVPDLGTDNILCMGDSLVLNPGTFDSYMWQDGSSRSYFTVTQPGSYHVAVTNGCGTAEDEVQVKEGACGIWFPSGFTPNNDGINDLFKVQSHQQLSSYQLTIVNRWGQKVFETKDPTKGWDGNFKGQSQVTGTYIWFCRFNKSDDPRTKEMKGIITLIR